MADVIRTKSIDVDDVAVMFLQFAVLRLFVAAGRYEFWTTFEVSGGQTEESGFDEGQKKMVSMDLISKRLEIMNYSAANDSYIIFSLQLDFYC